VNAPVLQPERSGRAPSASVVDIHDVVKRFGQLTVLDHCSLRASEGEILTLLGPSGCGKTTLLRCIAGFINPNGGSIRIDNEDTIPIPVNRRPVGVVFQSYALFPHLTVARNVGYGLRMRRMPQREIDERVAAALQTVSMSGLEQRYPSQLSGGQQQRVAIARVLVLQPRVLLLDEPFNALDAKLRGSMQVELRLLIKRLGITTIFVTHDQEEAMTLSDRIAVMRAGRIEQLGTPEDIYDRPTSAYVADFVGASNVWTANASGGRVALPDGQSVPTGLSGVVKVMVRPHNLLVSRAPQAGESWIGRVQFKRHVGALIEYEIGLPDGVAVRAVVLRHGTAAEAAPGDQVALQVRDPSACMIFDTV
jgi:ABC-type Fe3+/spermidine/putrescine transport system ATPase subunit